MRIIFLDDNKDRHAAYRRLSIGDNVDYAFSAKEAVRMLDRAQEPYDVASLDHDLDEYATMGQEPRELTGEHVAKHIALMAPERRPKKIIVHSYNGTGARKMVLVLRDAGVRAFWRMFKVDDRQID
jgi:hypothetical protein